MIASIPLVALTPTSISFSNQYVGTSGLPQSVTLANNGNNSLFISSVTVSPGDFGMLNACGSPVAAGTTCAIGVFFDPTAGGARSGTLTINDNAPGSPHSVALSGTGQDFLLAPAVSSSATVSGGQTAHFSVAATPVGGFNQSVALTCSGAPALSACTVSPSSIALNGTSAVTVDVMVTTTAASQVLGDPRGNSPSMRFGGQRIELPAVLLGLLVLSGIVVSRKGRSGRLGYVLSFALFMCIAGIMSACGNGSGGASTARTPTGTYTLIVSGRFASGPATLTHNSSFTLTVQ
jgi:hypothetical protein